jgi:branched-chain amino acid transport system ATP-binding protein
VSLLEVRNLNAFYGLIQILWDISLSVDESGVISILGANGTGKTTLLRALSGLTGVEGEMLFAGTPLRGLSPHAIARAGIAHVPEGRGTFTGLTVEENLRIAAYAAGKPHTKAEIERIYDYFPPLARLRNRQGGGLSGGEQQMLAIGRALMMRPKLLLLDEPSQGLAPQVTSNIFKILARLNEEEHLTILLVEQNAALALDLAHFAYVLEKGRIALSGEAKVLRVNPDVRRAYLGY